LVPSAQIHINAVSLSMFSLSASATSRPLLAK